MPPKFAASLKRSAKTDNHAKALPDKIEIRRRILAEIAAPVFDAFAGSGQMHRHVWHAAPGYVGCDMRWFPDGREAFVADNRRVMRTVDLQAFGIFDLDAYGSPWEQVMILAARRVVKPGERIGLVITEGSGLKLKMGKLPWQLARLAGLSASATGLAGAADEIHARAIERVAELMRCRVARFWKARGRTGAVVRYYGLVLEGVPPEGGTAPVVTPPRTSRRRRAAAQL